ncbi:MAG: winged helix-turn-helix domain-containing protein [Chloroflexi bacterium]|nr:winged helix-turn-helix domain-containing protein [Chloroflexota bacterium]MDA1146346.1 winged helix-turn-helix domain-containing protein [Chloroflexota bacterium]
MNTYSRKVLVGERTLELSRVPFDLLVMLLRNRGGVVETSALIREVWGFEEDGDAHFAHTALYRLRKQLRDAGAGEVIESIRGVGFRIPVAEGTQIVAHPQVLELALMQASTAVLLVSAERRVVWANSAAAELTGYSIQELFALPSTAELTPPERRLQTGREWGEVMTGTVHRVARVELLRKDQSRVEIGGSWKLLQDPADGGPHSILELWRAETAGEGVGEQAAG